MESAKGYYSLIQYCPDPSRAEAATIGVALFSPAAGFADARIAGSNRRISRFFGPGSFDPRRLDEQKQSILARVRTQAKRLAGGEDLPPFLATFANELTLTPARPMKVADPEQDLAELYAQLVGEGDGKSRRPHRIPQLDEALSQPRFERKVCRQVDVTVPVLNTRIRIPYAYQNGRLNLIKPESFSEVPREAVAKAMRLAAEGDLLYRHVDAQRRQRQLLVVAAFGPDVPADLPGRISQLFAEFDTRIFPESRLPELLEEIEQQAHPFEQDA